jgi:RNA recognition motif-containing protein
MAKKLFVGGLAYAMTDDELRDLFAAVGTVVSARIIMDRETNRSKGFGFVEMENDDEADAAIKELDGKQIAGRAIAVNEARPQERRERPFNGGGGNGGGFRNDRGNDRRY